MGKHEPVNNACMSRNAGIRILLTTVCKPYGVPDKDAEALGMQMELLNNQITRRQHVLCRTVGQESVIRQPPSRRVEYGKRREVIRA